MDNYFRYLNQKCPICEQEFNGSDDIVVCPLCGTPHHRDCYKKNGECGNFDKHNEGFRWIPAEQEAAEQEQSQEQPQPQVPPFFQQPVNGGASINNSQSAPTTAFFANGYNPLSIFPKEMEDGVETEEIAEFVQVNSLKYVQNFFYVKSKKTTFSWAAFLFAPYWFFYRKLHKIGAIFMALMILLSVGFSLPQATQDFANDLYEWASKYENVQELETEEEAQQFIDDYTNDMKAVFSNNKLGTVLCLVQMALLLAVHLLAGFKANELYYKHTIKNIRQIKAETQDQNSQKLFYFKKGGISASITIIALLGYDILTTVISYLFQYI